MSDIIVSVIINIIKQCDHHTYYNHHHHYYISPLQYITAIKLSTSHCSAMLTCRSGGCGFDSTARQNGDKTINFGFETDPT